MNVTQGRLFSKSAMILIIALASGAVAMSWGSAGALWTASIAAVFIGTALRSPTEISLCAQAVSVAALIVAVFVGGVHGALIAVLSDGPLLFALQESEHKKAGRGTSVRLLPVMTSMTLVIAVYFSKTDPVMSGVVLAVGLFFRIVFFLSEPEGSEDLYPRLSEHHLLFFPGTAVVLLSPQGNLWAASILTGLALILAFIPRGKFAVLLISAAAVSMLAPEALPAMALAVLACGWLGWARIPMIPLSVIVSILFLPAGDAPELWILPGLAGFALGWTFDAVLEQRESANIRDAAMGALFIAVLVAAVLFFPKIQDNILSQPWPTLMSLGVAALAFVIKKYGLKSNPSLENPMSKVTEKLSQLLFSREGSVRASVEHLRTKDQTAWWNLNDDWIVMSATILTAILAWGVITS